MNWEQQSDKEELLNNGALVINKLEEALTFHLGDKYQWEWRSVVGDCVDDNPIWSLTLYVEPKEEEQDDRVLRVHLGDYDRIELENVPEISNDKGENT